jgi:hypothetical protein
MKVLADNLGWQETLRGRRAALSNVDDAQVLLAALAESKQAAELAYHHVVAEVRLEVAQRLLPGLFSAIDKARESLLVAAEALREADNARRFFQGETGEPATSLFFQRGVFLFHDTYRVLEQTAELSRKRKLEGVI